MELKNKMSKKDAIIETLNFAFPTIITSGTMMVLAGFFIGQMSSNGAVSGIGQCLARGTVMSIITVMFVLPQILLVGEKIIDKTSFAVSIPLKLERTSGLMRVDGLVQGQINGVVTGEFHGFVRGEANLFVRMGRIEKQEEDGKMPLEIEQAQDEEALERIAVDGTAKDGSAKDGSAKDGSAKAGTAKAGTAKDGTAKAGTAVAGSAKEGTVVSVPATGKEGGENEQNG